MSVDGVEQAKSAGCERSFRVWRAWSVVLTVIIGGTNLIAVAPLPASIYPALHWIIFLAAVGIGIALAAKKLWPLIWWPILTALFFVPVAEAAFSRGMWTVFNVIEVVIAVIMVIVGARSTAGDLD